MSRTKSKSMLMLPEFMFVAIDRDGVVYFFDTEKDAIDSGYQVVATYKLVSAKVLS